MDKIPEGFVVAHPDRPVRSFRGKEMTLLEYQQWLRGEIEIPYPQPSKGGKKKGK